MKKRRVAPGSGILWNVKSVKTQRNINEGSFILGRRHRDGNGNSQDKLMTFLSVKFYFHDLNIMELVWGIICISLHYKLHWECSVALQEEKKSTISRTYKILLVPKSYLKMDKNSLPPTTDIPTRMPH